MTALIVPGAVRLLTQDRMPKDKYPTARRTTLAGSATGSTGSKTWAPVQRSSRLASQYLPSETAVMPNRVVGGM